VERIVFAAGTQALRAAEEQERKLKDISSIVEAPVEKLNQHVQTLVTENKKLTQRLDKLSTEWAEREAHRLISVSKIIDGIKFCQEKYTQNEENELISTINKITEQAPSTVVLLILARDTTRILVGAGKEAVKSGVHSGKLATQLASLIGGGGGGKDYFGQGGGTKSNVDQIFANSESLLHSMLKK